MEFKAQSFDPVNQPADCLLVPVPARGALAEALLPLDNATGGLISRLRRTDLQSARSTALCHQPAGLKAHRLLLVSTGDKPLNDQSFISLIAGVASQIARMPIKSVAICLEAMAVPGRDRSWCAQQMARLFGEAIYRADQFKSKRDKPPTLGKLVLKSSGRSEAAALNRALNRGGAVAEGVNLARELGDMPANLCNPTYLANRARDLADKNPRVNATILDEKQMTELKMGSLLSVSAGSDSPAQLIVLEYQGAAKADKPVVLVGKGVTFDSGGISLKPGAGMDEMKYDMCGAASVLGALHAAIALELPINLVVVIPAVENMPSGKATRPGDIVTSMSGQTIEVLNTDAEGRLILCDALTYVDRFKPASVIDVATLTGACVIALGNHAHGLFSNNEELANRLLASGESAGDRAWRLPLWEEYDKQLKTNFADMANIGGRNAGCVTAACFLGRFTGNYRWAHLDIAGTAWNTGNNKGATGRPVPLLVDYLLGLNA